MTDERSTEMKRLRERISAAAPPDVRLVQADRPPAFVGQVFADPTVPTTTGRFFSVRPVAVLGAEAEGQQGSLVAAGASGVLVYVIGSRAPVAGDYLVCRFVPDRWVSQTSPAASAAPVSLPGCTCTSLPATLHMISANPSCAAGMFQSCTLAYGPTPSAYAALNLGSQCFLSTASFPDQGGQSFRYYFSCQLSQFTLSRVYAQSIYGSPYMDIVRYSWSLNAPGNTCSPLLLSNGHVYIGGDTSCSVTISA
jgi:hypothetical protein